MARSGLLCGILVAVLSLQAIAEELRLLWEWRTPQEALLTVSVPIPLLLQAPKGVQQAAPNSRWAFPLPDWALYGFAIPMELPPQTTLQSDIVQWEELPLSAPLQRRPCQECSPGELLVVQLVPIGSSGDRPVAALRLLPYHPVDNGTRLRVARQLRLHLRLSRPSTVRESPVLLDFHPTRLASPPANVPLSTSERQLPTAPDGFQYKLIVRRQGLVRVTARQLLDAGLPLAAIPVATLRLWNRGREIPLYVYDRNNNGYLDDYPPDPDYIALFGEPNRLNFRNRDRDMYLDPETEENVYALTWGGGNGKRMVEESGDIRILDPRRAIDLRGKSFRSTVIVEHNRVEERFGAVEAQDRDLLLPSFQGDQLFWARVPANTSVTLPVPLPAPALLAADSVRVEVMLCGAIARPLPCPIPEHTAEIYLNRRRILRASWSGARPFIVQSPRHQIGPIPASVLAEADSSTITVANIFDCPQAGDRLPSFYVNWVRIEYPRLYVATNDELWFCTPPGSPPGVYTFVLEGFQTPNVLLFRAGISRILNYNLERV